MSKKKGLVGHLSTIMLAMVLLFNAACSSQQEAKEKVQQTLPLIEIPLKNMEAFQKAGGNWALAGKVRSNPQKAGDLRGVEGTGVLINRPDEGDANPLVTKLEHGDLELELDFLLPKGSDSGIFLMGRYELQLSDSWGSDLLNAKSCGGILQANGNGHAPAMNASRAPGLWQHLKVIFKAPLFDESGKKSAPAQFEEVWLNGVLIQQNVEVKAPAPDAYFEEENSQGPLIIQADKGPVAIKNIRYKKYDKTQIDLVDLAYGYYPGEYQTIPQFDTLTAAKTQQVDSLTAAVGAGNERFALKYGGQLQVVNAGTFLFKIQNAGMVRLTIDGKVLIDQQQFHRFSEVESATIELDKGTHSFSLEYIDHPKEWLKGLALFGEGPQLRMQKFHTVASVPGGGKETPPIVISTDNGVRVIRSFATHKNTKRTHVVNVGSSSGIHYNYDMGQAALLHVWDGPFINTSGMWVGRGSQFATPLGPVLPLNGLPALARLDGEDQPWPDSLSWDHLQLEGYRISEEGWPVFKYQFDGVAVTDQLQGITDATGRRLKRTVTLEAASTQQGLWYHLASGEDIYQRSPGHFVIDNRSYYLKVEQNGGAEAVLRQTEAGEDLLIPVLRDDTHAALTYTIVW